MVLTKWFSHTGVWQLFLALFIVYSDSDAKASASPLTQIPTKVHHAIEKAIARENTIDRIPVESGIYLQRIIKSYNAHITYAIIAWLNKELLSADSYTKELSYLLSQLDTLSTPKQAIVVLARVLSAYSSMMKEPAYQESSDWLERAYCAIALQSSVVLVNSAREQLLMILDEIHDSLEYWKEQKDRPVKYFFHKSPVKWVKGKRQADEVASNIKKLEKLEHDIRVILGRLTKHIYAFDIEGDVNASYSWIEKVLSILSCIGISQGEQEYGSRFEEIAEKLRFKLGRVGYLKDVILSKVAQARKPGHLARNWMMYAGAALAAYQARNFYLQNTDFVQESLKKSVESVGGVWKESVTDPVKETWEMIFGKSSAAPEGENLLAKHAAEIERVLPGLEEKKNIFVEATRSDTDLRQELEKELRQILEGGEHTWADVFYLGKYGGAWGGSIITDVEQGKLKSLEEAISKISFKTHPVLRGRLTGILLQLRYLTPVNAAIGIGSDVAQILPPTASSIQIIIQFLNKFIKSNELNMKLLTLIPAFGIGLGLNKMYNWIVAKDYSAVRLALLDINSLFIESTAPLSDHNYGKLIYLLQGLKLRAMRYLTRADMLSDFLTDLAKLESDKFIVETKRSIIQNMFMKYPFLQLPEKSS